MENSPTVLPLPPPNGEVSDLPTPESLDAPQQSTPAFTRVPTKLLGAVLDGGLASAYAAHLLAIKASKGRGFVLNERHVAKGFGISRRAFQSGIALMKRRKVLERRSNGRSYAVEQPLTTDGGYVLIEDILLRQPSKLLAFVLVVRASPRPMRPVEAARRIGLRSAPTAHKLAREAIELDAITSGKGQAGELLVARRGYDFSSLVSVNKNETQKNDPENNDASHRSMEEVLQATEESHDNGNELSNSTLSRRFDEDTFDDSANPSTEWMNLADWRDSGFAREWEWNSDRDAPNSMSLSWWWLWLDAFGAKAGHLRTPTVHRQALALAHELEATDEYGQFDRQEAMVGIAFAIGRAVAAGKTIRSLGFIAQRLLMATKSGDASWVVDRRSCLPDQRFIEMSALADRLLSELKHRGVLIDEWHLVATMEIEWLEYLVRKYGRDLLGRAVSSMVPDDAGEKLWSWLELEEVIDRLVPRKA